MKEIEAHVAVLISLGLTLATSPAIAQSRSPQSATSAAPVQDEDMPLPQQQRQRSPLDTNPSGRTLHSSAGQVGQRQTRDTAAQQTGIKPMARIASRVQNRVQNRIRNRVDRYYNPQANATDPFAVAGDEARKGSPPR